MRNEDKKLKKIEEIRIQLNNHLEILNSSYVSKDGLKIDSAINTLFTYLDKIKANKQSSFYIQLKNNTWQRNHTIVIASISNLMQEKNRMPTNREISVKSGLSEETIYKHLKEFKNNELMKNENDKFLFMVQSVLATLYKSAKTGDVRACKVYLDYFANIEFENKKPNTTQNNYVQINNTIINQSEFEKLNPIQQKQILKIFSNALIDNSRFLDEN